MQARLARRPALGTRLLGGLLQRPVGAHCLFLTHTIRVWISHCMRSGQPTPTPCPTTAMETRVVLHLHLPVPRSVLPLLLRPIQAALDDLVTASSVGILRQTEPGLISQQGHLRRGALRLLPRFTQSGTCWRLQVVGLQRPRRRRQLRLHPPRPRRRQRCRHRCRQQRQPQFA